MRRAKTFSSRSRASDPETSRTVTNIRVKVAATAIAKMSSGGGLAADHRLLDLDRLRDRVQQRPGEVEVVAGERAKSDDLVERAAQPPAAPGRSACRISRARPQPEDVERLAEEVEVAAVRGSGRGSRRRSRATCRAISRLASLSSEEIRSSTSRALTGSSSLTITSTSAGRGQRGERVDPARRGRRAGSGRRGRRPTRPCRSPRPRCRPGRTRSARRGGRGRRRRRSRRRRPRPGVSFGTSLRKATRGLSGPRETAKPTRTAISTG